MAIEEWRGASPPYTQRIRKAMRVEGDDVASIFKSLQLDRLAESGATDLLATVFPVGADAGGSVKSTRPLLIDRIGRKLLPSVVIHAVGAL